MIHESRIHLLRLLNRRNHYILQTSPFQRRSIERLNTERVMVAKTPRKLLGPMSTA